MKDAPARENQGFFLCTTAGDRWGAFSSDTRPILRERAAAPGITPCQEAGKKEAPGWPLGASFVPRTHIRHSTKRRGLVPKKRQQNYYGNGNAQYPKKNSSTHCGLLLLSFPTVNADWRGAFPEQGAFRNEVMLILISG